MSLLDKDSSEGENITSDMYEHLSQRQPRKSYCRTVLPWATTTMLSLCLSIYLGLTLPKVQQPGPFDTDLPALHSAVVYEERAFTRELSYDPSSGRVIRIPCDREPEYFGEPNETVDAAWEDLMRSKLISPTKSIFLMLTSRRSMAVHDTCRSCFIRPRALAPSLGRAVSL